MFSIAIGIFAEASSKDVEIASSKRYSLTYNKAKKEYNVIDIKTKKAIMFSTDSYNDSFAYIIEKEIQNTEYLVVFVETRPEREIIDGTVAFFLNKKGNLQKIFQDNVRSTYIDGNVVFANVLTALSMDDSNSLFIPIKIEIINEKVLVSTLLSDEGRHSMKQLLLKDTIMQNYSRELVKKYHLE